MNEDQLNDLKQFIAATVSQATAGMATKDEVSDGFAGINQRLDEIQSSISDVIATNNDAIDEQLTDHEHRLTKLEHQSV
jgi:septal ring factor EnvC (AmiA/AmiB activator)